MDDFSAEPRAPSKAARNILIALAIVCVLGGMGLYALVPTMTHLYGDYQVASAAVAAEPGAKLAGYRMKSMRGVTFVTVTIEPATGAGSAEVAIQIERIGKRMLAKMPPGRTVFVQAASQTGNGALEASGHAIRRFGPELPADMEKAAATGQ